MIGNDKIVGQDGGFRPTDIKTLQSHVAKRFSALGVSLASHGWPGRIDADLASVPELSKASIDALAARWTLRWADGLVQDLRQSLLGLETDARYYADLNYRLATYIIEQFAQDGELAVHNDEVAAGWLTVASEIAKFDTDAQQLISSGFADAAATYAAATADPDISQFLQNPGSIGSMKAASATVSSLSPYKKVHDDSDPSGLLQYNESVLSGMHPVVWTPTPGSVAPHTDAITAIYNNADVTFSVDAKLAAMSNKASATMAVASADSAAKTLSSKQRQLQWSVDDVGFRTRRTQLQLDTRALRRDAFETPNAPFDYASELTQLRERFVAALAEIVARASVVQQGANTYYRLPVAPPPMPYDWADAEPSYLVELSRWASDLQTALTLAMQYEAGTVASFSVRSLDPAAWAAAQQALATGASPQLQIALRLPAAAFAPYYCIRLRGLSASVAEPTSGVDGDSWRGRIVPPKNAVLIDEAGNEVALTQPAVPCDLARIASMSASRQPDMVGMSHLRNIAPISPAPDSSAEAAWHLAVERYSVLGKDILQAADLKLDLMVSGFVPQT